MYRSVVGALQYCTLTCLDINYVINKMCQYMHSPSDVHWQAIKRILRYLRSPTKYGIFLQASPDLALTYYADVNWASCPYDRCNTSDYSIYLGFSLVSWIFSK